MVFNPYMICRTWRAYNQKESYNSHMCEYDLFKTDRILYMHNVQCAMYSVHSKAKELID